MIMEKETRMAEYANVDKLMKHAISLDWSTLKWVNEVDISTAINPNVEERKKGTWIHDGVKRICPFCKDFIVTGRPTVKYCWNCGARLEERSKDAES